MSGRHLLMMMAAMSAAGPVVNPVATSVTKIRVLGTIDCRAIFAYNTDGFEYTNNTSADVTADVQGSAWLTAGASNQVWVERIINSGSLDFTDPGAGRLNLGTTRTYGIVRANAQGTGTDTASVTFNFYNASSGGILLASKLFTFTAEISN